MRDKAVLEYLLTCECGWKDKAFHELEATESAERHLFDRDRNYGQPNTSHKIDVKLQIRSEWG